MMMEQPSNKNISSEALTSIYEAYTLSSTQDPDEVMKNNFLQTLAEISMSIAIRKINQGNEGTQCEQ